MAEFFVYACNECHSTYAGALKITDGPNPVGDQVGICGTCLEQVIGWHPEVEEEMESREDSSGTTPNA